MAFWFFPYIFYIFLHYHPVDKNVKADTLSWSSDQEDQVSEPQYIINPVALYLQPQEIPPWKTFIPLNMGKWIISRHHFSKLAGNLGVCRTLEFISLHCWGWSLAHDIKDFVVAHSSCAQEFAPKSSWLVSLTTNSWLSLERYIYGLHYQSANCIWMHLDDSWPIL